ncbi:MBL fold metallo-hydrolase [Mycolicibacterium brumae]|uniref:Metallo-beta-lactamase domain-containing protein n=1 Tax=Mycolicibacterium brumae TaxID=85968 RepID=A0A2G5PFM9_9MYCO|nr:MBL fold metallo-hydrolase [Mycolicibacterium brumae]MCV7191630.1 MBL fold metallo-hydrolase [Mycolicibacterium brumae]PIB76930.1 hypothetical protein CQY22_004660 [Mycolicibacterium brumae]RWA20514.1 hypothetical protein MBRU_02325 [Mycolicibacterium brumae DSM 44177]UWW07614.1 MBL fold metallo-hydrolase [Mycolicibacterium brumae]
MLGQAIRLAGGTAAMVSGGWVMHALHGVPKSLGASPMQIHRVAKDSPNYRDGVFHNTEPSVMLSIDRAQMWKVAHDMFGGTGQRPAGEIPVVVPDICSPAADLAATWMGHSSVLIEVDGYRVLADPVWSQRCSPSQVVGPARLHPTPLPLSSLPAIDAVIISHDHYDHLDTETIVELGRGQNALFYVPLGIGQHLRRWGIPDARITELDWGERARLAELELVCTPARHFSGRSLSRDHTLWSSWAVLGPRHRVFFGGDTGYTKAFADVGDELGPFDLTLMPVGAYHPSWPDIHMNPEEAVRAHRDVSDSGLLVPIHWATFRLAPHAWSEPVERMLSAAAETGVATATPRPGQRVAQLGDAADAWWREL